MRRITPAAFVAFVVVLLVGLPAAVIESHPQGAPAQAVPQDLTPLLAPPSSEMRLVVTRYNADRNTLSGHYAGQSVAGWRWTRRRTRRRRGAAAAAGGGERRARPRSKPPAGPCRSRPATLARLKRYDLDWQAALGKTRSHEILGSGEDRPRQRSRRRSTRTSRRSRPTR